MKLAVIYDSKTGNTKKTAEWIAEGMNSIEGVEARTFSLSGVDEDFVKEANGIVIGSPVHAATMTPALHNWILCSMGKLGFADKLGGAFATEQYSHGGATVAIQNILQLEFVAGMLCYSSGAASGKPVIHLGPVAVNDNEEKHNGLEFYKSVFEIYGQRFAKKAKDIF